MKTALDSSVILDVLTDDQKWGKGSEMALSEAYSMGQLIIGECVLAEIMPALAPEEMMAFLSSWKISFYPSTLASCYFSRGNLSLLS